MENEEEFYEKMKKKWGPFSPILMEWEDRLKDLRKEGDE